MTPARLANYHLNWARDWNATQFNDGDGRYASQMAKEWRTIHADACLTIIAACSGGKTRAEARRLLKLVEAR
jgi:hypothetical protein